MYIYRRTQREKEKLVLRNPFTICDIPNKQSKNKYLIEI